MLFSLQSQNSFSIFAALFLKNNFLYSNDMKRKKIIFLIFILECVLGFAGSLMKINHIAYANVFLGLSIFGGLVFLYFLISFFIKVKEQ